MADEKIQVVHTSVSIDGVEEPCIEVIALDGFVKVRIQKMYHLVGNDTLLIKEFVDGEFNSSDEFTGDFDIITDEQAIEYAKEFSAHIANITFRA